MLEMGAATAGIGDDGVELVRRKLVELLACEALGKFPFPIVGVQGPAAVLFGRSNDFATVMGEHLDRIAVDVAEDKVLGAANKHRDPIFASPNGGSDWSNEVGRELRLHFRGHRFQFAQALGKQPQNPASAYQGLDAKLLIKP